MTLRARIFFGLFSALVAVAATGCATADAHRTKRSVTRVTKAHKRDRGPANYSLYRPTNLDRKLLRRGQRESFGTALDSY